MKRFPVISRVISCLSLAMFGLPCIASNLSSTDLKVVASDNDSREYRYVQLDNKLQVLLISDPTTEKSAAALDINVGSNQNPKDREGLAHFLEHMLFLGTEKYPSPGEYQEFISEHGGSHNAYTSSEHTNYFFDVDARHFDESLDRFAQFFVAPLFSETYVDRERHAVESEYKLRIKNESRRRLDVYSEIVNPEHPLSMFRTGNLVTLSDRTQSVAEDANLKEEGEAGGIKNHGDTVRKALVAFYQRYYSANLMSLVVLGNESLDKLEAMTASRFGAIPNTDAIVSDAVIPLYRPDFLPAKVNIKPLKEERRLSLSFPIPSTKSYYRQKPLQYIGNLLGHEGEGSLLSFLKKYGWAEGLSAGGGDQTRFDGSFDINILLTERGVKAADQIAALAFHVIQNLERKGIKEWRFDEDKALADIAFRFQEKSAAIDTVSALANRLHTYAPEDVLRGAYLFEEFDPVVIRQFLSHLKPDNVLMTLTAPNIETDKVSRWYQTSYKVASMEAAAPFIVEKYSRQLFFPKENLFIPQRLRAKSTSLLNERGTKNDAPPEKIIDVEGYEVWFKQDDAFDVPKANINLRLKLPMAAQSAKTAAMNKLFVALVNDSLTEFTYPASLAGLHFSITSNSRGIDISVDGYNDRQGLLLNRIVETIRKSRFDSARFESVKAELIRGWDNANKASPYQQLAREVAITAFSPLWQPLELRSALASVSLADFNEFNASFLINAEAEALFYGNLYRQEAMKLSALIQNQLLHKDGDISLPRAQVVKLEAAEDGQQVGPFLHQLPVDHKDTAAVLYVQGLDDSIKDKAKMLLLRQMFHSPFFNSLRTEKQLGYVVMASGMPLKKVPGSIMLVQSPTVSGAELIDEISGFIDSFVDLIPEDLSVHKQALSNNLLQAPKSLAQQSSRYWDNILYKMPAFDRRKQLVAAINGITHKEFIDYYDSVTLPERRVWFLSKNLAEEQLKGVRMVENPAEFKREAVVYSYQ